MAPHALAALGLAAGLVAGGHLLDASFWESTRDCYSPDGTLGPCRPGVELCAPPGSALEESPRFHIADATCRVNDPNGPVYDPKHGVYHLFYQDHLAMGHGRGPIYGHVASRDMVHWARLPVAIWNDQPYDSVAIYSGSAVVDDDGSVVQIYPGLCRRDTWDACTTGTNLAIALPEDPADPLLRLWQKPKQYNPVVNGTQRDPTTPWRERSGEWRLTTYNTMIYASLDLRRWYTLGHQPNFVIAECPGFFPLPPLAPGSGRAPEGTPAYTHVYKYSVGRKDWMVLGTYEERGAGVLGAWTPAPNARIIDRGASYASKDFYDPAGRRRINWAWALVPPASAMTLPREITWHAALQQLVFSPLEEQAALRARVLARARNLTLSRESGRMLVRPSRAAGAQAEVLLEFALPRIAATFGVRVGGSGEGDTGCFFFVRYRPPPARRAQPYTAIVGARCTGGRGADDWSAADLLQLLPAERSLRLRVFADRTMAEGYWQDGRVALTAPIPAWPTDGAGPPPAGIDLMARDGRVAVLSAEVHAVADIWVPPEQLLGPAGGGGPRARPSA